MVMEAYYGKLKLSRIPTDEVYPSLPQDKLARDDTQGIKADKKLYFLQWQINRKGAALT